ncbi:hypothetical protein Adt_13432 [Abeliophyllum distichum]|uniref:Uncharacterized protein n=1 Tax=Abeliophyllum distichum TaxID=126358 RepID=A0ABD1TWT4_9LAMI
MTDVDEANKLSGLEMETFDWSELGIDGGKDALFTIVRFKLGIDGVAINGFVKFSLIYLTGIGDISLVSQLKKKIIEEINYLVQQFGNEEMGSSNVENLEYLQVKSMTDVGEATTVLGTGLILEKLVGMDSQWKGPNKTCGIRS